MDRVWTRPDTLQPNRVSFYSPIVFPDSVALARETTAQPDTERHVLLPHAAREV